MEKGTGRTGVASGTLTCVASGFAYVAAELNRKGKMILVARTLPKK
jgi:hypothetical protein